MKLAFVFATFASSMVLASFAQATSLPSNVVPTLCSESITQKQPQTDLVKVEKVCVGVLQGTKTQVVVLQINDGTNRVYSAKFKGGLKGMGAGTSKISGRNLDNPAERITGTLAQSSGITTTNYIRVVTTSNLAAEAELDFVFSAQ